MTTIADTGTGRLQGYHDGRSLFFGGIPYAASPAGALRFRPPEPPEAWSGVRPAVYAGPIQPQNPSRFEPFMGPAPQAQSEDSLSLDVWTPALDDGARPVMMWIHGGAYVTGAGSFPLYDCGGLAAAGDIVCVSINYRLGERGYLNLAEFGDDYRYSGNSAVLDQIAALEWIKANIARFGGDPGQVTVTGQSAGAGSITALMAAEPARGLFHRGVIQSISYMSVRSPEAAAAATDLFMAETGASSPADLEAAPIAQLLAAQRTVMRSRPPWEKVGFQPMVDGDLIPRDILPLADAGELAPLPIMLGTTTDEWNPFQFFMDEADIPRGDAETVALFDRIQGRGAETVALYRERLGGKTSAADLFCAALSDYRWWASNIRLAETLADKQPVYLYEFAWCSPSIGGRLGAGHCVDIPFWLGNLSTPSSPYLIGDAPPAGLASQMSASLISFVRGGEPGGGALPDWPRYDEKTRAVMRYDVEPELMTDPRPDLRAFWVGAV